MGVLRKHISKIPPKSQDIPVKNWFVFFFFVCFFCSQGLANAPLDFFKGEVFEYILVAPKP